MKYLAAFYNSALWAMLIALMSFRNEWLEMRANIGLIFIALWVLLFAAGIFIAARTRRFPTVLLTAVTLVATSATALLVYGPKRLMVVPAALIRESLGMPRLSFSTVNGSIAAFLLIGAVILLAGSLRTAHHTK